MRKPVSCGVRSVKMNPSSCNNGPQKSKVSTNTLAELLKVNLLSGLSALEMEDADLCVCVANSLFRTCFACVLY